MSPHRKGLDMYTVYVRPKDYPECVVVRKSTSYAGRIEMQKEPTHAEPMSPEELAKVHHCLAAMGLVRLEPSASDDPVIESVWL